MALARGFGESAGYRLALQRCIQAGRTLTGAHAMYPSPRHLSSKYLSQYCHRSVVRGLAIGLLMSSLAPPAWAASAPGADTARALVKSQEIKFSYNSFSSFYSCDGIEGKVKRLLLALGATKDLEVEARSCAESSELIGDLRRSPTTTSSRSPLVTIRVTSAVEATPENIAELEKTRSQRELSARVRGDRGTALDAEAQFDAPWKAVSLSRGSLGLEPGDCELVDALRKQVLPKLGVRVVKDNLKCSPRQGNRFQPQLEVEALQLPPPPEAGAPGSGTASPPAAGETKPPG
jgi:hypothetical protein